MPGGESAGFFGELKMTRKARIIEIPKNISSEFYSLYKLQYQRFGIFWVTKARCTDKDKLINYYNSMKEHEKKTRKIVWRSED